MSSYRDVEMKVLQWAEARRIIPNAKPSSQLFKAVAELGELCDAFNKGDIDGVKDGVGDTLVCLINFCALMDIDMVDCLNGAYEEIKNRKGTMLPNGLFVKE